MFSSALKPTVLFINNKSFKAERIEELKGGLSIQEAKKLTANNGLDEVFFSTEDGKKYVAYGDGLAINKNIKKGLPVDYNCGLTQGKIEAVDNETNTFCEGVKHGLKKMKESVYSLAKQGVAIAGIGAVAETLIGVGGLLTVIGTGSVLAGGVVAVGGAVAGGIYGATRKGDYTTIGKIVR